MALVAQVLLRFTDQMVPRAPPVGQARVIAAAFACDHEYVTVRRLTEALVRPDGDRIVSVEVAENMPAWLVWTVEPLALATP